MVKIAIHLSVLFSSNLNAVDWHSGPLPTSSNTKRYTIDNRLDNTLQYTIPDLQSSYLTSSADINHNGPQDQQVGQWTINNNNDDRNVQEPLIYHNEHSDAN